MADRDEQLIRRALGRRSPPIPGPTLADDVLRRVAAASRPAPAGARRALAVATWLLAGAACVAVLARLPWSGRTEAVAWVVVQALVPLAYAATLWPRRFLRLLASCGGSVDGKPRNERWPDRDARRRST